MMRERVVAERLAHDLWVLLGIGTLAPGHYDHSGVKAKAVDLIETALTTEREALARENARLKGLGVPADEVPEDPRYVIGYQREQWNYWQQRAEQAEAVLAPVPATLEAREAPDLAKEIVAWLDNNVVRCGHGGVMCGLCYAEAFRR